MPMPDYRNPRHRFKAAWCACGHPFNCEVEQRDGEPNLLISAAAWLRKRDNFGQPQLAFEEVAACPACGRVCDQAWSEECYVIDPRSGAFVAGRHDPGEEVA